MYVPPIFKGIHRIRIHIYVWVYICILKKEYIYTYSEKSIIRYVYTHTYVYMCIYMEYRYAYICVYIRNVYTHTHTFFNLGIHYGCFLLLSWKSYMHTKSLLQPIANGRIPICHKNKPHQSTSKISIILLM